MPSPVSVEAYAHVPLALARRRPGLPLRMPVNLIALERMFRNTCCSRPTSPTTAISSAGGGVISSLMFFACARRPLTFQRGLERCAQIDRHERQIQLVADDARHIEQVFDQLRLRARASIDGLHRALALTVVEPAGLEQMGPADDRVHRRAQLVRQVREELVFQASRLFGMSCERRARARKPLHVPAQRACDR